MGLGLGSYNLTVRDEEDCEFTRGPIEVTESPINPQIMLENTQDSLLKIGSTVFLSSSIEDPRFSIEWRIGRNTVFTGPLVEYAVSLADITDSTLEVTLLLMTDTCTFQAQRSLKISLSSIPFFYTSPKWGPNPLKDGTITLFFSLESQTLVQLRLTEISGKTAQEREASFEPGLHSWEVPLKNLSSGLYHIQLRFNGENVGLSTFDSGLLKGQLLKPNFSQKLRIP